MDVIVSHGLGLDVPKKSVMACRITPDPTGRQPDGDMERRECGTMPFDWLAEAGITPVAMQSTGEYGQPVLNLLEGNVAVCLVNAAHVKQVPGRKTNKADARWLTNRMREGVLTARFSPPRGQRDRRDLTRYRTKVVQERSRESGRVHGVLERANIKLAALAKGRRHRKIPLLEQALTSLMRDHHRRVLVMQWAHIDFLDAQIETLNTEIAGGLRALDPGEPPALPPTLAMTGEDTVKPASPLPPLTYERAIALWDTVPGFDRRGTEVWVAETGLEMAHFGTASRLAAWAGSAPGNDASVGKQRSGRTRLGDQVLRALLTQLVYAAARAKGMYLSALYHRLPARRGKKRAIVAVAQAMVVSAFHRLVRQASYRERGANDFDEHRRHAAGDRLMRRIEHLGDRVHLEPLWPALHR